MQGIQKTDELFFQALNYLSGGSQHRNLGISAIELYWRNKRHRDVSALLLVGAAVYLLTETKHRGAQHEKYNLKRIMQLLFTDCSPTRRRASAYGTLSEILAMRIKEDGARGLQLPDDCKRKWQADLDKLARCPTASWRERVGKRLSVLWGFRLK